VLGAHGLGLYTMAWTLGRVVPERVGAIVTRVAPAFLSSIADDPPALRRWIYRLTEGVALVTFPLSIGLALVAPSLVPIALGAQWVDTVGALQVLCVYGALDAMLQLVGRGLTAAREVRTTARLGVVMAVVMPLAFLAGARYGPAGIAWAWLAVAPALRVTLLLRARQAFGLELRAWLASMWPALRASMAMVAAVMLARGALDATPPTIRLAYEVAAGAAAYVIAVAVMHAGRFLPLRAARPTARA
jgi:PST family polysaccharide transporter